MKVPFKGAIDCDLHPAMPGATALLPYVGEYWRDQLVDRHIDRYPFTLTSYPPNSPLSARPDWRQPSGAPGGDLDAIRRQALDPFGSSIAICNVLHGAVALFNEDMAMALCSAVNDWVAKELLDREPRLRASILVPLHNPELAVAEIERVAKDRRFVQVLLFAMNEMLLGRRIYWPIYAAAEKHGLAIGIHAGSTYRHAPMASGWPAHRVEDYIAQSAAFESQLLSFLAEGVFQKFTSLRLVLIELGFTWLPNLLWRTSKGWRGMRPETPWIDRLAGRDHPRARARDLAAGRCAEGRRQNADAGAGTHRFRPDAAVLDRLSALAVRRRRRAAGRASRRSCEADPDRQSAGNLSAFARGGANRR